MKKITIYMLALTIMFSLAACSENNSTPKTPTGAFSKEDLFIVVDNESFTCGAYMDSIIDKLGENYNYSEAISCAYDGLDKTFEYADLGLTFYTRPDGSRDIVTEVYSTNPLTLSSREVAMGTSGSTVEGIYGLPNRSTSILDVYQLVPQSDKFEGASLYFEYGSDGVVGIGITDELPIYE